MTAAVAAVSATPGSDCTIRVEDFSDTPQLDYFLGGEVDVTGSGCVVSEPGVLTGTLLSEPSPAEIQSTVDFLQMIGDSAPCNQFFDLGPVGFRFTILCPN